jgi:hypothetical protein
MEGLLTSSNEIKSSVFNYGYLGEEVNFSSLASYEIKSGSQTEREGLSLQSQCPAETTKDPYDNSKTKTVASSKIGHGTK